MRVPFALPDCGEEEIKEVIDVIKSGWLTTASRCTQFERDFAEFVGAKHALAVNSATAALHLGLEGLGIGEGDKVLLPTLTFTATAEVIRYLKADPVFVDCDPETFCITPTQIETAIERCNSAFRNPCPVESLPSGTRSLLYRGRGYSTGGHSELLIKAIIPVHLGGHPCEMDSILELARSEELSIIEDAAHAFPTYYEGSRRRAQGERQKGAEKVEENEKTGRPEEQRVRREKGRRMVGTIGDITCFSFYANKTITTGEGGMLCTDNDDIARRAKIMRLHGIDRDVWHRFSIGASWEYDVVAPGFKYNMPDINAALGIHQLRKAEKFREKRQRIAEAYYESLSDIPGLILPRIHCMVEDHSWCLYNVLIDPNKTLSGIDRNAFIYEMTKRGIGTSVHYKPIHRMTYYKDKYGLKPEMFPNAEWVFQRCVSLPIYSAMRDEQLSYVIESTRKIMKE